MACNTMVTHGYPCCFEPVSILHDNCILPTQSYMLQADSLISGYCFLRDSPAATAVTAVAAVNVAASPPSIAVDAAVRYGYILGNTPECSAITLSQTEFYANKAIGGGGGAIFWDGPVEDLIVICSDVGDVFGEH